MYEKILVPLDGSAFAEAALPLALSLSRKTGKRTPKASPRSPLRTRNPRTWCALTKALKPAWLEDI